VYLQLGAVLSCLTFMLVAPELIALFNALPTPHLLLSPAFVIEAASDAYLHATLTSREYLVGQYIAAPGALAHRHRAFVQV
jgi:hypothetical protein